MFRLSGWHRRWHMPSLRTSLAICLVSGCVLGIAILKPFRGAEAPSAISPAHAAWER